MRLGVRRTCSPSLLTTTTLDGLQVRRTNVPHPLWRAAGEELLVESSPRERRSKSGMR